MPEKGRIEFNIEDIERIARVAEDEMRKTQIELLNQVLAKTDLISKMPEEDIERLKTVMETVIGKRMRANGNCGFGCLW
jgi:hypothetical protein